MPSMVFVMVRTLVSAPQKVIPGKACASPGMKIHDLWLLALVLVSPNAPIAHIQEYRENEQEQHHLKAHTLALLKVRL